MDYILESWETRNRMGGGLFRERPPNSLKSDRLLSVLNNFGNYNNCMKCNCCNWFLTDKLVRKKNIFSCFWSTFCNWRKINGNGRKSIAMPISWVQTIIPNKRHWLGKEASYKSQYSSLFLEIFYFTKQLLKAKKVKKHCPGISPQ